MYKSIDFYNYYKGNFLNFSNNMLNLCKILVLDK